MVRDEITKLLIRAGQSAQAKGTLPSFALPDVSVQRPANPTHGDYASSLPLKLARAARMSPIAIAQTLVKELPENDLLASVEVAPPGFINFTLSSAWLARQVDVINQAAASFGCVDLGQGKSVQIEFVSANPTGPLTAASGRGGALGDALANILAAAGYHATREYYVNDAGSRMDAFNQTLFARYSQVLGHDVPVPADGYHGAYMTDVAREIVAEEADRYLNMPRAEAESLLGKKGLAKMVESIKSTIDLMGIHYDQYFSEQTLYDRGIVAEILRILREKGYVEDREGAVWLVANTSGDSSPEKAEERVEDKANVLVRSNGIPTYFASDIAYHYDKFIVRKLDQVIDIWGADHQGHVRRMKAGVVAVGVPDESLKVLLHQMITLKRGNEIVRLSKRTGDIITLREVLEDVGADACRFFFLSRSADAQMDFDLDLAKTQSSENPVYYVQYAHARIASILRVAGELNYSGWNASSIPAGDVSLDGTQVPSLLTHDAEQALIRKMLELPELVEVMARNLEPHHLPHYAQELAAIFHQFYTQCRVITEDKPLTMARLKLVAAARTVLGNSLRLMGISAPEAM